MTHATVATLALAFVCLLGAGVEGMLLFYSLALVLVFHARATERAVAASAADWHWVALPRGRAMWALCGASAIATWSAIIALLGRDLTFLVVSGSAALTLPFAAATSQWDRANGAFTWWSPLPWQAALASGSLAAVVFASGYVFPIMTIGRLLTTGGIAFLVGLAAFIAVRVFTDRDAEFAADRLAVGLTGVLAAVIGLRGDVSRGVVFLLIAVGLSLGVRHPWRRVVLFTAGAAMVVVGFFAPSQTDRVALTLAALVPLLAAAAKPGKPGDVDASRLSDPTLTS